jgi:predicted MFS family arabinose efflux permease
LLAGATFLIFFQAYMVAPLIPRLAAEFGVSGEKIGLAVPAYMLPYGVSTLFYGLLSDRLGRRRSFGSTLGVVLAPFIGWRMLFVGVAVATTVMFGLLLRHSALLGSRTAHPLSFSGVFAGYRSLLQNARGARTYTYVLLNSVFHSGVFTWLGLYFAQRYRLGDVGIGLALLGYGVPGFLLGPVIGRAADRWGRRWLVPIGLGISAFAAAALILDAPLAAAAIAVTLLSLGYDMTQPLLAGIVTALGGPRGGQAMGLNVFTLFIGFGLGSLLFGDALRWGFDTALALFSAIQFLAALLAVSLFRDEISRNARPRPETQPSRRP